MSDHYYTARDAQGGQRHFHVRVVQDRDHWVATCDTVDETGRPAGTGAHVAPLFYGIHEDQALRRMVGVLENQYDDVVEFRPSGG